MTSEQLRQAEALALHRTREAGRLHYHPNLAHLVSVGSGEPSFGKTPCQVCGAFAAGDRYTVQAWTRPKTGGLNVETSPHSSQARELEVCPDCLAAWA